MKKILTILSFLAFTSTAWGWEVPDDSSWTNADGSVTVTVDVVQYSSSNSTGTTVTHGDHTSNEASGTPGASSSESNPTCEESGNMSSDAGTFRIKDGKLQKKNADGTWSNWKRKKKKSTQGGSYETLVVGQPAPANGWLRDSLMGDTYLLQGEAAPYTGYFTEGEEVTSLPQ